MGPRLRTLLQTACLTAALLSERADAQGGDGLYQKYCSTQNTAGNYAAVNYQWQSDGACKTQCQGSYAFAVVKGLDCWCSNYIPSSTVDASNCNQPCPGYPDDLCGNDSTGLYGYIALGPAAAGVFETQPVTTSSQTSTSASSSSAIQSSSTPQLQSSPTPSSSSSSSSTTSSSTSDTSTAPSAVTSVQIVTVSGAVVYKTVTSTPIPASAQDANLQRVQQTGLSGGAIAGIVVGVLAAVAAILLGLFLLWRRRRAREQEEAVAAGGTAEKNARSPKRNVSVLSRSGLLARMGHDANNEKDFDEPIHPGTNSQRHSMLFGAAAGAEGVSPASPLETTNSGDSRRHSKPMVYDQRLNPSALFATHDNGSRASMQDGADYSRTLGVTNPDPRPSFESRVSRA